MHAVWYAPAVICTIIFPSSSITRRGVCCLRKSPRPSWPCAPSPHVKTSPPDVSATLWFSPQQTSRTPSECSAFTSRGFVWIPRSPCPNWPSPPKPHEYTAPSEPSASTWREPHANFRTSFSRRISTSFGCFCEWLSPWPSRP